MSWSACCGSLLRRPEQQVTVDVERSQAAPEIYSSGTRRGPLTAATGYRVTAVQDEGAGEATAARNFPVHHRAASEPADTRPGLPTGVGPMIDVRSGEARDPYLAGITAYDQGRDVLRTEFKSLPARVIPPVLKA